MAGAPATRIFISYSRKDAVFVSRLKDDLQAKGYDAFVDTEEISGGEEWKKRLDQLILNADAVAFVVSPDSVASAVCDWETKRTLALGKRLVPLLWRPLASDKSPTQLTERNYIFFDNPDRFDAALTQLCNACDVDISWVREHTRLTAMASRWEGRNRDVLLRGRELDAALAWLAARAPRAPDVPLELQEFLKESEAERLRTRRNAGRVRTVVALLGASVLAGGLAFATQNQWRPALDHWYLAASKYRPFVNDVAKLTRMRDGEIFQDCERGRAGEPSRDCPQMVLVVGGEFRMGKKPEANPEGPLPPNVDSRPSISVARFAVSRSEVTFDDWQACVSGGGCKTTPNPGDSGFGRGARPVINVSWNDAEEYVNWLSGVTGQRYRLLTDAEWEYAARAKTDAAYSFGDDASQLARYAWFADNSDGQPHPVAMKDPNAFGLYDMHGNVYEWTQDCSGRYVSNQSTGELGCVHSLRGGSWAISSGGVRSSYLIKDLPSTRNNMIGFRVARTIRSGG